MADAQGAFFPVVSLFVDSVAGFIAGVALGPAEEMPEQLPRECLKAMQTHGRKPEAFLVCRENIAAWLKPMAKELGIPIVQKQELPMAEGALKELRGFMRTRGK